MGKVGITPTSLLRQNPHMGLSGLFSFIISCHLLFHSFLPHLFHLTIPNRYRMWWWWVGGLGAQT